MIHKRQKVIFELVREIHEICESNKIQYFLADKLALLAYRKDDASLETLNAGRILMTAENFRRFIEAYNAHPNHNRVIEWMGNNESFPGLFLRYINTETVYYTPQRLSTEKYLGMYVTIDVIRPAGKRGRRYDAIENAWANLCYGYEAKGRKLEPIARRSLAMACKSRGNKRVANQLANFLLKKFSSKNWGKEIALKKGALSKKKTFSSLLFQEHQIAELDKQSFYVPKKLQEYLEATYGQNRYKEVEITVIANQANCFCDTDLSYKELDLMSYRDSIREVLQKTKAEVNRERAAKKKRQYYFDIMTRTFYRYYYAIELLPQLDTLEEWYSQKDYIRLDEALEPYVRMAKRYKNKGLSLYLNDRLNSLIKKRYEISTKALFGDTPEALKKTIKIYDFKGEYIKSIGDE